MYILDLSDILFFVKSIKQPSDNFNILHYVSFSHGNTRCSSNNKLCDVYTPNNTICSSQFVRFPRLWNSLPPIDIFINQTMLSKLSFTITYGIILILTLISLIPVHFIIFALAPAVISKPTIATNFNITQLHSRLVQID